MKKYKKLICLFLAAIQLFGFVGCVKDEYTVDDEKTGEVSDEAPERDYCRIDGKDLYFLDSETLESLREPLIKLLANRKEEYHEEGQDVQYLPPDPNSPSVECCYSVGLFDFTGDGIPELLAEPRGFSGSSGSTQYNIYDIKTGELLREFSTGWGSICDYFDTSRRAVAIVESSGTQMGHFEQHRYLYVEIYDSSKQKFVADINVYAEYVLADFLVTDDNTAYYFVDNKPADWFEYYNVIDSFYMDYVRIPETELQMFSVWDIDREYPDRFVRAEKLADLLLSSGQKFIIPNKDTAEKDFGEELCLTKSN